MRIDAQRMEHLQEVSGLSLSAEEAREAAAELERILEYAGQLHEPDISQVEAMYHPFPGAVPLREDEVLPSTDRERILAAAPQQKDGYFQTPQTLE